MDLEAQDLRAAVPGHLAGDRYLRAPTICGIVVRLHVGLIHFPAVHEFLDPSFLASLSPNALACLWGLLKAKQVHLDSGSQADIVHRLAMP